MVWSGDLVFASGGYPERSVMAIKADGSGEVVWEKRIKCYVPSMLIDGERLLVPEDDGILHCLEAATGKELWKQRLGGSVTSSPVLADGNLFVTNEEGTTFVLKSGAKFDSVGENSVGDRCYATPTICGGRVYLRTYGKFFCIGDEAAPAGSE
jgi:outer membrane protein assembly factor BamB